MSLELPRMVLLTLGAHRILSLKSRTKLAGYIRRAGGVNPLVTLLSQIGNQLARESYQGHN